MKNLLMLGTPRHIFPSRRTRQCDGRLRCKRPTPHPEGGNPRGAARRAAVKNFAARHLLLLLIFITASLTLVPSFAQQAGCCCDPVTRDGSLAPATQCPQNFIFLPTITSLDCTKECKTALIPTPTTPDPCADPQGRTPQNLHILPVKGQQALQIDYTIPCPSDLISIERCTGTGCTNFKEIALVPPSTGYTDNDPTLEFNTNYTYRISTLSSTGKSTGTTQTANIGDLECLHQTTTSQYCITKLTYEQHKTYLTTFGYLGKPARDYLNNFDATVTATFSTRFNNGFACDQTNRLIGPVIRCGQQTCVSDGTATCITPSPCITPDNTFGLLSTTTNCEGQPGSPTFCFLDKSATSTNKCYQCSPRMNCYDYKSKQACQRNTCRIGQCSWNDIIPTIGIGVCIDTRFNNCPHCNQKGSQDAPNKEAHNTIFDQCTPQKTQALSTPAFPCFFTPATLTQPARAIDCSNITCTDYTRSECGTPPTGITLDANNNIQTKSTDPCGIGTCDFTIDSGCRKNADGTPTTTPFWEDCSLGDKTCEQDHIPPETTILPIGTSQRTDQIRIHATDKTSRTATPTSIIGQPNHTTLICIHKQGTTPCTPNIPITKELLNLNDITLKLQQETTPIADLTVGQNTIRAFSTDKHKNKEPIKQATITACQNCAGPQLLNLSVSNSRQLGDTIFTGDNKPQIRLVFNKPSTLTAVKLTKKGITQSITTTNQPNTHITINTDTLTEEEHILSFNAQDQNGFLMTQPAIIKITPDFSTATLTIIPPEGSILNDTSTPVILQFSEQATLDNVTINRHVYTTPFVDVLVPHDATNQFATNDNTTYRLRITGLTPGPTTIDVKARDIAGRQVTGNSTVFLNKQQTKIRLAQPPFGFASSSTFTIIVETTTANGQTQGFATPPNTPTSNLPAIAPTNTSTPTGAATTSLAISGLQIFSSTPNVDCRYAFDTPAPPAQNSHSFLPPFDNVTSNKHTLHNFNRIKDNTSHPFHVLCKDSFGITTATFPLRIDTTPPHIIAAFADPTIVAEEDTPGSNTYRTTLKIHLSKEGFCKHSTTSTTFDTMENTFPGFDQLPKKVHLAEHTVTSQGKHSINIACKSLAGLTTPTQQISFNVDTTTPFTARSLTPITANTTNITITVATNKRSFCNLGTTPSVLTTCMGTCNLSTSHSTTITANGTGTRTFHIQCTTASGGENTALTIPITIDTTPPLMTYVKDDGPLPDKPELQFKTDRYRAAYLGNDTETNITLYLIRLDTSTGTPVIDWTPSTRLDGSFHDLTSDHTGKPLQLQDKQRYILRVKPVNIVGLTGPEATSNGATIDTSQAPTACANNQHDGQETDKDCGGPTCTPCTENKLCRTNNDCQSNKCDQGTCAPSSCNDNTRNSDETDTDCGGSCQPCTNGQSCIENKHCTSNTCTNGICGTADTCNDGQLSPDETDIDCGGACQQKCNEGQSCSRNSDCTSGTYCITNTCTRIEGTDSDNDGIPDLADSCPDTEQDETTDDQGCSTCQQYTLGDDIPDCWRTKHHGCITCPQAETNADNDLDGLTNIQEYQQGTNPTLFDTDNDGYGDGDEVNNGYNPLSSRSHPRNWLFILLMFILIIAAGIGAYAAYNYYQTYKSRPSKPTPPARPPQKPAEHPKQPRDTLSTLREFMHKPETKLDNKSWLSLDELTHLAKTLKPEEVKPAIFKKLQDLRKGNLQKHEQHKLEDQLTTQKTAIQKLNELRHPELKGLKDLIKKQGKTGTSKTLNLLEKGKLTPEKREKLLDKLKLTSQQYKKHKKEIRKNLK